MSKREFIGNHWRTPGVQEQNWRHNGSAEAGRLSGDHEVNSCDVPGVAKGSSGRRMYHISGCDESLGACDIRYIANMLVYV